MNNFPPESNAPTGTTEVQPSRHHRWVDWGTIVMAVLMPMALAAVTITYQRFADTQSARETSATVYLAATFLWWLALLAWSVLRSKQGNRQKWDGKGLRIAALVVVVLSSPMLIGGFILSLPVHALFKIIPDQRKLLHGTDHRALADACAIVMADYRKYEGKKWDDPALPRVIRNVRPAGIDIAEHGITMEMHGGFDHYGFRFRQDASNTWTLSYYTERHTRPLVTGVVVKSLR